MENFTTKKNLVSIIGVCLISLGISFFTCKSLIPKPVEQPKFVQIDLVKISSDYMQKAILLVAQINDNVQLTPDQKLNKAQEIMKVVGSSLDSLVNDYSSAHHVVVLQKQMIASDEGFKLADITAEIESQIDTRIDPNKLHDAASK
jgi:hypothetical protein